MHHLRMCLAAAAGLLLLLPACRMPRVRAVPAAPPASVPACKAASLRDAETADAAARWAAAHAEVPAAGLLLLAHDHLVNGCTYDPDAPFCHSAYGALILQRAVCDGYAAGFALLAEAAGIRCMVICGTADGVPHAWNLAEIDGAWYHIDCTWDEPPAGASAGHDCFLQPDAVMRRTHSWDAAGYPAAEGTAVHYADAVQAVAASVRTSGTSRSRPPRSTSQ